MEGAEWTFVMGTSGECGMSNDDGGHCINAE